MLSYSVKTKKETIIETSEEPYVDTFEQRRKLAELDAWFNAYFRMQLEQHSWQKDYKPSEDPYFKNDDGTPKSYATFEDVIEQAEIVREEIKNLRKEVTNAK